MKEVGIDISHKKTQSVFDFIKKGERFAYVIAVCDEASAEKCPIFPGALEKLHWSFSDPSNITGMKEEKLEKIRVVRYAIKEMIR